MPIGLSNTLPTLFVLLAFIETRAFADSLSKETKTITKTPIAETKTLSSLAFPEILMKTSDVVWGFDFIDKNKKIIFTERKGTLKIFDLQTKAIVSLGEPLKVWARGQGGLLDVLAHPQFEKNKRIYLTYSKPTDEGATTALATAILENNKISDVKDLFVSNANGSDSIHFGSRFVFSDHNTAFMSIGERNQRDRAQDDQFHNGKILKLSFSKLDQPPIVETWSKGHRNPQGLSYDKDSKTLWSAEFGPRGGDELNLVEKGKNYGWPIVTFGREYYGPKIGEGTEKPGMTAPLAYWVPSISPSGLAVRNGIAVLACLSGQQVRLLKIQNQKMVKQLELFKEKNWRFRQIRFSEDGAVWASTDEGLIIKFALPNDF